MAEALLLGVAPKHGFATYQAGLGTRDEKRSFFTRGKTHIQVADFLPLEKQGIADVRPVVATGVETGTCQDALTACRRELFKSPSSVHNDGATPVFHPRLDTEQQCPDRISSHCLFIPSATLFEGCFQSGTHPIDAVFHLPFGQLTEVADDQLPQDQC